MISIYVTHHFTLSFFYVFPHHLMSIFSLIKIISFKIAMISIKNI